MLHSLHPSSILLALGPIQIHWYGLLIVLAIAAGFFIARRLFKKYKLAPDLLYDLGFYLILGGLIGARWWHVLSEINYYWQYPLDIFKIWHGGLAIHGAILGGIIAILLFNSKKLETGNPLRSRSEASWKLLLLDIFAPLLAFGQAIGRWGNYFNQELYGRPAEWGIPIDLAHRLPGWENFAFFQPIFIYESLWCLMIFIILIYTHYLRLKDEKIQDTRYKIQINSKFQNTNTEQSHTLDEKTVSSFPASTRALRPRQIGASRLWRGGQFLISNIYKPGTIFLIYLILYSLARFSIGFLRIDPQFIWFYLRLDQWVSLLIIVLSVWFFRYLIADGNGYSGRREKTLG